MSFFRLRNFLLLLTPFALFACEDKMESHYEAPDWLRGNIKEILEEKGDYSLFLKGVDLAGYTRIFEGKSILTVMAPNDSAMSNYLRRNYQTEQLEDLSLGELRKLIGYHLLYYSFDKERLINFRPNEGDGATEDELMLNAGLYYKFRTKSQDPITEEMDTAGNLVNVYHLERFLPIFSYRMFKTKQIDAKYNYEYFFPNTPWMGDDGFNVANASVIKEEREYAIPTKNGYVYLVDRVLEPLNTIYKELDDDPDFSHFLDMYNRNTEHYDKDDNLTLNYGNGKDLYQHYHHDKMPDIACEWPVTDYTQISQLAYTSYSIFAPTNDAFDKFFEEYWKVGGYDSLAQVSEESMSYLLNNCVYSSSIVFPEEIKKGTIISTDDTPIKFDVDKVEQKYRKMCSNGVLYGCTTLTPPAMFGSVTGPAYQYKKYGNFLRMLSSSDLVSSLYSDVTKFIMLYPSDEVLAENNITYDSINNQLLLGTGALNSTYQQMYVFSHVANLDENAHVQELPSSGTCVLKSWGNEPTLYWYVKDGKLTNSVRFNELLPYQGNVTTEDSIFSSFSELKFRGESWSNGLCYEYGPRLLEGSFDNAIYGKFIPMMITLQTDETTAFYQFTQLLKVSGLLDMESQSILGVEEDCLMLIPTNEAVLTAVADEKIPGLDAEFYVTDEALLKSYLLQYFIPLSTATISNYPFVGWGENTTPKGLPSLMTLQVNTRDRGKENTKKAAELYAGVNIYDDGSKLSVEPVGSNGMIEVQYFSATDSIDKEYEIIANGVVQTIDNHFPLVKIEDNGSSVKVGIDVTKEKYDVDGRYYYFPFVFDDGCVHFINGVF